MGSRIRNQKDRRYYETNQNVKACKERGGIGDRSGSLTELIGLERVVRKDYGYEGTFYVTEDGELYDDKYVDAHNPPRTGVKYYEVTDWRYNKRKQINEPIIRRIVMIENKEIQLLLDL